MAEHKGSLKRKSQILFKKKKLFDNRFGGEIGNNQHLSITCFNGVLRKCYFDKANFEGYLNNFKNYILCNEFQVNELC